MSPRPRLQLLDISQHLINRILGEMLITRTFELHNHNWIVRPLSAEPERIEKQQIRLTPLIFNARLVSALSDAKN